ncbi:MAG TPA: FtsQ-type POTRA domain-containing protein [Thermoleophilaceae bacterium]
MSPPPANSAAAGRAGARLRRLQLPRLRRGSRARMPALPTPPRHLGRWLLGALALSLVVLATYHFWFRDSSLVRVEQVRVSGATSADAGRLRATLTSVARSMTTLDVDRAALEQAVVGYPVVRGLEISADFPHTLRIRVLEHVPAAIALVGDSRVPVAGDGTVLRGVAAGGSLPTLHAKGIAGNRLADPVALRAAQIAGAAPVALRRRLEDVTRDTERGLVAHLRDGPELVFGGARRVRAKWIAVARVLADGEAQGATYIDVRLPSRPAVGGLGAATVEPVAPAAQATPLPIEPTTPPVTADPSAGAAEATTTDPVTGVATTPAVPTATPTTPSATPDPSVVPNTQP